MLGGDGRGKKPIRKHIFAKWHRALLYASAHFAETLGNSLSRACSGAGSATKQSPVFLERLADIGSSCSSTRATVCHRASHNRINQLSFGSSVAIILKSLMQRRVTTHGSIWRKFALFVQNRKSISRLEAIGLKFCEHLSSVHSRRG